MALYDISYTNIILTAIAILLSLVIAGFAWYHRRITGAIHLAILSMIGTIWGLIYLVELLVRHPAVKLLFDDLQFIPASFLPPIFLLLTMVFTGNGHIIHRSGWLLYLIPCLTAVMIATNNYHFLFRKSEAIAGQQNGEILTFQVVHGPWFWVIVATSLITMLVSALILLYSYLRAPRWSRVRTGGLLLTAVIISAAVGLSLPAWIRNVEVNLTLVALLIALTILSYSLLSNRMLEAIPLAARTLLGQINDAVITLNSHGEILDFNQSAHSIPILNLAENLGESFPELLRNKTGYSLSSDWAIDHSEEITLGEGKDSLTYDMRISPVTGDDRKNVGLLVVLRDITRRKQEEHERVLIGERYQAILQNAGYAILLLDEQGRIRENNQKFTLLSGLSNEELQGLPLQVLVPALPDLSRELENKSLPSRELTLHQTDSDPIPVEMNITPISSGKETFYFVTLQDIRERKEAESITREALANVQSRVNDLAVLRNVTEALNQASSLRNAVQPVLETVKNITNSNSVWIFLLGKTSESYQRIEYHPLSENNMLVMENQAGKPPRCLANLIKGDLESARLIKTCPCSTITREREHYAFPLYINKQPLGLLNFVVDPSSPLTENNERLLKTICGSLAVAIERVRLFKSEYDQRKLAETYRDIGTALTTSLDLNEVLDLLLDQLSRVVPYDGASVMLVEDGTARVTRMRGYEPSKKSHLAKMQNLRFEIEKTENLKKLINTRKPVVIEDTHKDELFITTSITTDYHSYMGIPVVIEDRVAAIFNLDKVEAGFYSDDHARLVSNFALQASLAIRNASLFTAETNRIRQLDGLRATLTAISAQLDVKVLLQEVLKRAVKLLNADFGELALFDSEENLLRILASQNLQPDTVGRQFRRGEGLMGKVAQTKKHLAVSDYPNWKGKALGYDVFGVNSVLAVPMLGAENELLGVIGVGYTQQERIYNDDDIRLLNLFAQQATVALRNARLYEEAKRRAEEAETIRKAGAVVVSTLNQEKAISLILEQLAHVVPYDSASVLLYRKGSLQIVGGHGFNDIQPILGVEISLDRSNPGSQVFLDNAPLKINNIPEEVPHFNQASSSNNHTIHSWLGVPLKIQNQPIGILSLDGHTPNQFTDEHERLVTAFADQVAIALENARLYESALQSASRFETLYKLSQVISSNIRSEEIYPAIHEATTELMETEFFSISLVNEKSGLIEDVYMVDRGEPISLSSRPLGQGLFGRVLESGKSILFNTFSEEMISEIGALVIGDPEEDEISQSVLVVPLKIGPRLVGVVSAQSYKPHAYTDTDVELLELLGANVAIAVENARLFSEVQELAITDPVTGLYNRRKLIELAETEFTRARRYERDLSAIMLDCDLFKRVNDTYGHSVGDQVLKQLVEISLNSIRKTDILARYGGDEFMVILPETNEEAAMMVATRLCQDVVNTPFETNAGHLHFSISVGVAGLDRSVKDLGHLLDRADFASYVSKDTGGNRVTRWTPYLARKHKQPL